VTSDLRHLTITSHVHPDDGRRALRHDVSKGLAERPRRLPPKWFYDDLGSDLFDQITRLDEYYPTEAERDALGAAAGDLVALSGADTVVELGSGSSDKTTTVLDAFAAAGRLERYVPFDVSESALRAAAATIAERYPGVTIDAVVGDFDHHLGVIPDGGSRLLLFLGGTVGNYPPGPRRTLLASIADTLAPGDHLLLGTDLVKDPARLVAAYDDAEGITAEFNQNVLRVINRELDADFDVDAFEHVARWNAQAEWIEMRLRSTSAQRVSIAELDEVHDFADGEEILTEVSAKFRPAGIAAELHAAGFDLVSTWTDPAGDFAITLSRRRRS